MKTEVAEREHLHKKRLISNVGGLINLPLACL